MTTAQHYRPNLRDIFFNLFEVLEIQSSVLGKAPPSMQQMLEIAYSNSLRLGHLINDLLDMEKIAAGKMSFELREHSLGELLKESLASNQALCDQHGVHCSLEHATDVRVWVDGMRLQQVPLRER